MSRSTDSHIAELSDEDLYDDPNNAGPTSGRRNLQGKRLHFLGADANYHPYTFAALGLRGGAASEYSDAFTPAPGAPAHDFNANPDNIDQTQNLSFISVPPPNRNVVYASASQSQAGKLDLAPSDKKTQGDDTVENEDEEKFPYAKCIFIGCALIIGVLIFGIVFGIAKNPTSRGVLAGTDATRHPTISPTFSPTAPTMSPTNSPSHAPTLRPTFGPTRSPTHFPTASPSTSPTRDIQYLEAQCAGSSEKMRTTMCLSQKTWVRCEKDGTLIGALTDTYIRSCDVGDVCPCGLRKRLAVSDPCVLASDAAASQITCALDP